MADAVAGPGVADRGGAWRRHRPEATVFTRFIPPPSPEHIHGAWREYYRRWRETTLDVLDPSALELVPPLDRLTPPAAVVDKPVYSGFVGSRLERHAYRA